MYSQHNEDDFIVQYIHNSDMGVYPLVVDVGAGDGLFLSNSRLFIQRYGFGGILIEPTEEQFFQLKDLYEVYPPTKPVRCINSAISDSIYPYQINRQKHWTLNHIEENQGSEKKTVTLSKVIEDENVPMVGILSIDTEGMDISILKEFITNSKIRPQFILIEGPSDVARKEILSILKQDYIYLATFSFNHLFVSRACV